MNREFVLTTRREIALGTTEITLTTADGQNFLFQAGQYLDLIIPEPSYQDEGGNKRSFSIASAPSGPDIKIAFRQSMSAFKRSLLDLALRASLIVEGPFGVFTLPAETDQPLVFIAGGIGITPFRSILGSIKNVQHPMLNILYANREESSAAYLSELREQARAGAIKLHEHYGRLDAAAVHPVVGNDRVPDTLYYAAGPPGFVMAAMAELEAAGVGRGQIIIEQFLGYE